jgi:hypothetical protein
LVGDNCSTNPICPNAVNPDGAPNVLQLLLAHILEGEVELAGGILLHPRRHAYPSGLGQRFQPSGNINSVAEDIPVLDHDVAHVDANAELDALVWGRRHIALSHPSLHVGRTAQRIYHTAELDEQPIPSRLDQPAIVRGDRRINQLGPDCLQRLESAALVRPDQA